MNRREFLQTAIAGAAVAQGITRRSLAVTPHRCVAITLDDPNVTEQPLFSWEQRADHILAALKANDLRTTLFVCGKRIDSEDGKLLLKKWDDAGHLICNHSYSHLYYNAAKMPFEFFADDVKKGDGMITSYKHYTRLFRYPYLKEGDTAEKRDKMRELLTSTGYKSGEVTIDASDWAIDDRLKARLKQDLKADTKPYRDYYLKHILDRAEYYDGLSQDVLGRSIKHTVLLHHTLLNALYLGDLITEFKSKGWKVISADEAFADPVFDRKPNTLPAGESLLWALAKESGRYENKLRYPGEDDTYEKMWMDEAGL